MNWKKCLSMGMTAALVLSLSNLNTVKADEGGKKATAYIYFTDGWYSGEINYHTPGGYEETRTVAQEAEITGDGTYHLSLDFTKTTNGCTNTATHAKICIEEGDTIFGSASRITVKSVKLNGNEITASRNGYTGAETNRWDDGTEIKNTVYYLYSSQDMTFGITDREEGTQRTLDDLNPYADIGTVNIQTLDVLFEFTENTVSVPSNSPDVSPTPSIDPHATKDPHATTDPNATKDPNATQDPGTGGQGQNSNLVSNSTYTGAERILVQKNSVIIPAGKSSNITFALLRGASSGTQVTVSSGNAGIASPILQEDGKVRIDVPASAAAGSSTTVTLRFGSSTAGIKVIVQNPVTKIKAAKKTYQIKRKKKAKIVFNLTSKNKSAAPTDVASAKITGKKASVSSVKISGSKLTVTVKGIKKGSATLKATIGGKTAKTKIKIK